jgi:hypothetical protein
MKPRRPDAVKARFHDVRQRTELHDQHKQSGIVSDSAGKTPRAEIRPEVTYGNSSLIQV